MECMAGRMLSCQVEPLSIKLDFKKVFLNCAPVSIPGALVFHGDRGVAWHALDNDRDKG